MMFESNSEKGRSSNEDGIRSTVYKTENPFPWGNIGIPIQEELKEIFNHEYNELWTLVEPAVEFFAKIDESNINNVAQHLQRKAGESNPVYLKSYAYNIFLDQAKHTCQSVCCIRLTWLNPSIERTLNGDDAKNFIKTWVNTGLDISYN